MGVTVEQLLPQQCLAEEQRDLGKGQHVGSGVEQEECDGVQRLV